MEYLSFIANAAIFPAILRAAVPPNQEYAVLIRHGVRTDSQPKFPAASAVPITGVPFVSHQSEGSPTVEFSEEVFRRSIRYAFSTTFAHLPFCPGRLSNRRIAAVLW